jgi:hypothetical protein
MCGQDEAEMHRTRDADEAVLSVELTRQAHLRRTRDAGEADEEDVTVHVTQKIRVRQTRDADEADVSAGATRNTYNNAHHGVDMRSC